MSQETQRQPEATPEQISSPFSTGHGGAVFEMKVQAGLLATLLVRGHVPIFNNALLQELHLQAEHLGYETDDAYVVALDHNGVTRKQLWSVKREVKFTESDEAFGDVITDAWADFTETSRFSPQSDVFVLATGYLTQKNKHLLTLLDVASAAISAIDFHSRVERKGFVSNESREYLGIVERLCQKAAGRKITPEELWIFIRCFHIQHYDFDQNASQDEARFKTLLSLGIRKSAGRTGGDLWNEIFEWVASLNPRAGSFTRDSLPPEWQQVTASVGTYFDSGGVIQRLVEHSSDLLKRIRTTLGPKVHLGRLGLTDTLGQTFIDEQFTLVTGQAGSGKSAAALAALQEVIGGAPLFVFQATEFAKENLDHAFADLRISEPLSGISALFALHTRKFVLLESVERLLEAEHRDAFFMLLRRLAEDGSWRTILTCRQHAASLVQEAFLNPLGLPTKEAVIPLLAEEELDEVVRQVPGIREVVSNPRTRQLLRNPWFLDKACSVDWTKESGGTSLDQRRLRDILWQQVVVREDIRTAGVHILRDRYFRDISLKRARSLQSFVLVPEGGEAAVQALIADELLVEEPNTHRVAPAHDVLEDWALMRWVSETFTTLWQDPKQFFDVLGHEMAIRRSYRQWLQESLTADGLHSVRNFVDAVLGGTKIEQYWKDETIISILLSDESPLFLAAHEESLLKDEHKQLNRFIHLLRIACKVPNPLFGPSGNQAGVVFGDLHLVAEGKAWGEVIRLVHRNLAHFGQKDLPVLLGLLENWKAGINWREAPEASREASLIALHFWNTGDPDHLSDKTMERLARLIVLAPQTIAAEFDALLEKTIFSAGRPNRRYRAETLEATILSPFEGWAACHSHPKQVARLTERLLGIDRPLPVKHSWELECSLDMEDFFGLLSGKLEYFPASALQGPFFPVLQEHPESGVPLVLKLSNVAVERFVERGLDAKYENPIEIDLLLERGKTVKQWLNSRLWLMYRGASVAPNVFESALMALEKWLLNCAEQGQDLNTLARDIISRSNNAALTAVIASIAMAYPETVGDAALLILSVPEFYELDTHRYVSDMSPTTSIVGDFGLNAIQRLQRSERVKSDALPHRRRTLEWLTLHLQWGPLQQRVWKIIDDYKAQLPPVEQQKEKDKLWRLRLHRMDRRNFSPGETVEDGQVFYMSTPPDADVEEVVNKSAPRLKANQEAMSLLNWGFGVFEGKNLDAFGPERWREMLSEAQRIQADHTIRTARYGVEGGPAYVAAVCSRDHWPELNPTEKAWCRERLLSEIAVNVANDTERVSRFAMHGSRAAARVLPLLLDDADDSMRRRVREGIAIGVTHPVDEVREYSALAVGWYLWDREPQLASACIAGLLALAQAERRGYGRWRKRPAGPEEFHEFISREIASARTRIISAVPLEERRRYRFSITEDSSSRVLPLIAGIISQQQARPIAQKLWRQIAESFAHSWKRRNRYDRQRNYEGKQALKTQFAHFLIRCEPQTAVELWRPFAVAIEDHAEKVAEMFHDLIRAEDIVHEKVVFWAVWQETETRLLATPNAMQSIVNERSDLAKLGTALVLDSTWKEGAKDWKPLHGHEDKIASFVKKVGFAPRICKSYIRLLDSIGSFLLPEALESLDYCLRSGNPASVLSDSDSLFSLSRILTPLVFAQTGMLRKAPELRSATLRILDSMVEEGSSAAFRMRDFLITPATPSTESV
jgi:hypothetical protein